VGELNVVSIPWVNGGHPFEVGPGRFTPSDFRAALVAKAGVIKDILGGADQLPPQDLEALRSEAATAAQIAQMDALIYGLLCRVDPKLRSLSAADVRERLTLAEYQAILGAVGQKAGVADSRPLAPPRN
jgi:hypothetical protein